MAKRVGMASIDGVFSPIKAFGLMQIQDGQARRLGGVVDFIYIVLQDMTVEIFLRRVMLG